MSSHPRRRNVRSEKADGSPRLTVGGPRAATSYLPVALEEVSEAIFITDRDDRIQYWNAAAERQYGAPGRTMIGLQLGELYRPSWLVRDGEPLDPKALEAEGSWQGEAVHFTRHGASIHVQLSVRTLKDGAGTIAGHLWVIQDITERRRVEEALRASEAKFGRVLRNIEEIIYAFRVQDGDPWAGQLEFVSEGVERTTGWTPQSLLEDPTHWFRLIHPEDLADVERRTRAICATGKPGTREYRLRHRVTGAYRWFEDRIAPQQDGEGRLIGIFGVARDVTDWKDAERRLQQSELLLHQALELTHTGSWQVDLEADVIEWSDEAYRIFGLRPKEAEITFSQFLEFVFPEDRARVSGTRAKAIAERGHFDFEYRIRRRDGETRVLHSHAVVVVDREGSPVRMVGAVQDITERRQAELALQKSEERFRLLAENAQDVVYRYRLVPQRGFEYVSPSVTALTGYTPEEHYASPDLELDLVHPDDRGLLEAYLRDPAANTGPIVLRWLRKDGGIIWTEQRNVPLYDEAGHLVAIEGIVRDISDRRQAEERLQALSRRLLAVQESERRRLARELHDELGQELTAAQIQLQSLAAGRPSATATLLAKTSAIIDRTLNRVRNLSLDLRPSMLDDLGLVAALRWQVDRSAQLVDVKTRFTVDDPQRRYPAEIETACFRVAQEALTNAVRHAEATSIEVRLRREGAELVLEVRDDGIGFDVRKARERAAAGASLGLLSMQERAVLTGGTWQVLSEPGSGTVVVARFPISDLAEKNQAEEKGS